ncbi:MAG: PadR family transcriptional regulator [Candidatus Njordarchaeia archaeon]
MGRLDKVVEKYRKTLFSGFYTLAILLTIKRLNRPTYGYEIAKIIENVSGGFIKLTMGTLYPILKNLEKEKILKSFWAESSEGPPRKYYEMTEQGMEFTEKLNGMWKRLREAIDKIEVEKIE